MEGLPQTRTEAIKIGASHYYTGKPCKHGHLAPRSAKWRVCTQCETERWLEDSRKKRSNPTYAQIERERNRLSMADKLAFDPEWRRKKNESNKEYAKRIRRDFPERALVGRHKRRAVEANAIGSFTEADIKRINQEQQFRCVYCSDDTSKIYHADHITPLSRGGTNWPDNIQILCPHCNVSKKDKTDEEYRKWLARLTPSNDNKPKEAAA